MIAGSDGDVRIHLGAGGVRLAGWLDTDISFRSPMYLDATRPWPIPPGCVAHVYADNVIEHFSLVDARSLLRQAHRALKPGGKIRLATPDVQAIARLYLSDPAPYLAGARRKGYEAVHPVDLLRLVFTIAGHEHGYLWDNDALRAELEAAGFRSIERRRVGESDVPALRNLESRTDPLDAPTTLVVEATKP